MDVEVARVWHGDPTQGGKFNGTAFFINSNTLITAGHVVDTDNDIYINTLSNGATIPIEKKGIEFCERDIAILHIKARLEVPELKFLSYVKHGDTVIIKGFDDNTKSSVNYLKNRIIGYEGGQHTFRLQNHIAKGFSGSPILIDKKICGLVFARGIDKNFTYMIPIEESCSPFIKNMLPKVEIISKIEEPSSRSILFPSDIVPYPSKYYIQRREDKECYESLNNGQRLIRIKAPKDFGKTSLVSRIIHMAKMEHYIVELNFKHLEVSLFKDNRGLLRYICDEVADKLNISESERITDRAFNRFSPNRGATKYMEKILGLSNKKILLIMDDVDKLFHYETTSNDFFPLIRSWHQKGVYNSVWRNLRMILTHSTDASFAVKHINSSPFTNVGFGVILKPFNFYELKKLSEKHNILLDTSSLRKFITFIGGHPYLSRLTLYFMLRENKSLYEIIESDIYKEHLFEYLWKLDKEDGYKDILKYILEKKRCKKVNSKECYILESWGLIQNIYNNGDVKFTCKLYEDFFREAL